MVRQSIALFTIVAVTTGLAGAAPTAAAPTAAKGYSLTTFAGPLAGSSAPDSIATVGNNVFVSYGNGGDPTGAGGAMSTIAKYSNHGVLLGTVTVAGHSDGLRYDAATGQLWSMQNEDASPTLVLINPKTLAATAPVPFSATPHGGGYDDVAFGAGGTFVSASNPGGNPNTGPAVVSVTRTASGVTVGDLMPGSRRRTSSRAETGAFSTIYLLRLARRTACIRKRSWSSRSVCSAVRLGWAMSTASERNTVSTSRRPLPSKVEPLLTMSQMASASPMLGAISTEPLIVCKWACTPWPAR